MNYSNIKSEGLQGIDVSKEITLKEYGFGYHVLPKRDIYRFYIGKVDSIVERGKSNFNKYSCIGDFNFTEWEVLELPLNVKIEEEFDFINAADVANLVGLTELEWLDLDAPSKLYDAISYYGVFNF